ncbi:hypothetical protein [Micromonospora vulcania]|uniref:Peptidase inhibitor family I36 n=1 Tax=Micromonospora vulcania TaxID=1441873 RepID=A0ABW1HE25_9ACTN
MGADVKRFIAIVCSLLVAAGFLTLSSPAAFAKPAPGNAVVLAAGNPCGGSPYACANGRFIVYAGSQVCLDTTGNAPSFPPGCANQNTLFGNFGYRCSGCDWIRLYYSNYNSAYFCVPPGYVYGQETTPGLIFDKGFGKAGYGSTVWRNAASAQWSGPC